MSLLGTQILQKLQTQLDTSYSPVIQLEREGLQRKIALTNIYNTIWIETCHTGPFNLAYFNNTENYTVNGVRGNNIQTHIISNPKTDTQVTSLHSSQNRHLQLADQPNNKEIENLKKPAQVGAHFVYSCTSTREPSKNKKD